MTFTTLKHSSVTQFSKQSATNRLHCTRLNVQALINATPRHLASHAPAPCVIGLPPSSPLHHYTSTTRAPRTCTITHAKPLKEQDAYGPRGLLLLGFAQSDAAAVRAWLKSSGLSVSFCPSTAYSGQATVLEVLCGYGAEVVDDVMVEHAWEDVPGAPQVVFLSGLSGEEAIGLIEIWEACTGMAPPAFAGVTRKMLQRPLKFVAHEVTTETAHASGSDNATTSFAIMDNQTKRPVQLDDLSALREKLRKQVFDQQRQKEKENKEGKQKVKVEQKGSGFA